MADTTTWFPKAERIAAQGEAGPVVMRMMMASNDILLANVSMRPYIQDRRKHAPQLRYFFRLQCGHLREVLKLIEEVDQEPHLKRVLETCSPDARARFDDLLACNNGKAGPKVNGIVKAIRNKMSAHYDQNEFRDALKRQGERGVIGSVTLGDDIAETRYSLVDDAEDIIVTRCIFKLPDTYSKEQLENEINERVDYVHNLCSGYERFCREFVIRFVKDCGAI
jgi:hypothetical protein